MSAHLFQACNNKDVVSKEIEGVVWNKNVIKILPECPFAHIHTYIEQRVFRILPGVSEHCQGEIKSSDAIVRGCKSSANPACPTAKF